MILQHKLSTFLDATPKFQFDTTTEGHAGSVAACGTACSVGPSPVQHFLVDLVACAAQLPRQVATSLPDCCQQPNSLICLILHCQFCVFPDRSQFCVFPDLQSRLTWSDSLRRRGPCSIPRGVRTRRPGLALMTSRQQQLQNGARHGRTGGMKSFDGSVGARVAARTREL